MPPFDIRSYIPAFNAPLPGSSPIAKDTRKIQADNALARLAGAEEFDMVRFRQDAENERQRMRGQSLLETEAAKAASAAEAAAISADSPKYWSDIYSTLRDAGITFGDINMPVPGPGLAGGGRAQARQIIDPSPSIKDIVTKAPREQGPTAKELAAAASVPEAQVDIKDGREESFIIVNGVEMGVRAVKEFSSTNSRYMNVPVNQQTADALNVSLEQLPEVKQLLTEADFEFGAVTRIIVRDGILSFNTPPPDSKRRRIALTGYSLPDSSATGATGTGATEADVVTPSAPPMPFAGDDTGSINILPSAGGAQRLGQGRATPSFVLPSIGTPYVPGRRPR